jgi:hypothetical protein
MSNHSHRRPADLLANVLGPLDGAEVPGGCDECDAYQTVEPQSGVWVVTVHHDGWCPRWTQIRGHR